MSHEAAKSDGTAWWELSLSRRDAQKLGLGLAAVASVAGCDDSKVKELDSLDAQKKGGWDVGDENQRLLLKGGTTSDSKGGSGWREYLEAKKLLGAIRPANATYATWQMPTLVQALEQRTLAAQLKPVATRETQESYKRARAFGSLITAVEDPGETLLIVDVPGAHGPAAAAGMAEWVEPIFYYDNWPHPKGVVDSQQTLGSALFYAQELEEKKKKRDASKAPAALILDSNRLASTVNQDTQFDNRYFVGAPSAEDLKKAGIKRVVYVPLQETAAEADDLNDATVEYEEAGLSVSQVALGSFEKDPDHKPEEGKEDPTGGYYYGGSHASHTHFYHHYPLFIWMPMPMYGWRSPGRSVAPTRVRKPSYKPSPRKTMFSSRTTGGARGVGRTKPTGFGRVSTRMNSSGKIMGTRSGSTGRFRSTSSSGG